LIYDLETKELAGMKNAKNIATFTMDITNTTEITKLPESVQRELGSHVDILINNAGIIQPFVRINDLSMDKAHRVMNFFAPLVLVKTFLPELMKRQAHILNVASMGAYSPVPGQSVYGASKAALKLLTEGLRSELMKTNVGVTIAFPGSVAINITTNSGLQMLTNPEVEQKLTVSTLFLRPNTDLISSSSLIHIFSK
jgi:short-subunit dehydrogenase